MATLSEAYRNAPLHPQHIIPLDFESVEHVPESHSWANSDDSPTLRILSSMELSKETSLPVIDLADADALQAVGKACEAWGMFQVINHGISLTLLKDVESEARRFFSLPAKEKMKTLRSPGGAAGYGVARITPFFEKFMWHEGFTILGSPTDHAREVWPHGYHKFCEVMEEYQKNMKELTERLLILILKYLGLPEEHIEWPRSPVCPQGMPRPEPAPCTALQLNSYPSCPDPAKAMGLAPHTDSFLLTVLHQVSGINGLQVLKEGTGWVRVEPDEGALVVNVGDMLHIMSNGLFPSVLHRVAVDKISHRMSAAYFYGPPADYRVSPISRGSHGRTPLRFRPVIVSEYIEMKSKNLNDALSGIRAR